MLFTIEEKLYSLVEQSTYDSTTATLSISGIFTGTRGFYLLLLLILVVKGIRNLSLGIKQPKNKS